MKDITPGTAFLILGCLLAIGIIAFIYGKIKAQEYKENYQTKIKK